MTRIFPYGRISPPQIKELMIADGTAAAICELVPAARVPAVILQATDEPVSALTRLLESNPLDVLHLVAHGRKGAISLGGEWIDGSTLLINARLLRTWRVQQIALWSCQIGRECSLVKALSHLTGALVHSTDTVLGMTPDGPYWQLGSISPDIRAPFHTSALLHWPHQLTDFLPDYLFPDR